MSLQKGVPFLQLVIYSRLRGQHHISNHSSVVRDIDPILESVRQHRVALNAPSRLFSVSRLLHVARDALASR
jgi:hypothetical protein